MSIKSILAKGVLALAVVAGVSASPALAQGDAFGAGAQNAKDSLGATGEQTNNNYLTGTQTRQVQNGASPILQGATNGTIAPQGGDATVVQGVNTAGTVRVNNLANLAACGNLPSVSAPLSCPIGTD